MARVSTVLPAEVKVAVKVACAAVIRVRNIRKDVDLIAGIGSWILKGGQVNLCQFLRLLSYNGGSK